MIKNNFSYISLILFVILFLNTGDVRSQQKRIITSVEQAISLAMKDNSDVINARYDKLKAEQKVSEVYSENLLPTITLNSNYSRSFKKQVFDIFGEKFEIGSDNALTTTLNATEPIPVLGTPVFSGIRIAEYYSKIQQENVESVENDVRNTVKNSYFGVLLSKAVVDVNKITYTNAEENFKVVESRFRNGVATEFDFLRARVKVENVRPVLLKSERDFEISKKLFSNAIGLKVNDEIEILDSLQYDSTEVWESTDVMIDRISEEYVTVRQLMLNKKISQELVNVDKANYLPKLFLFGQYSLSSQENDGQPITNYRFFNTLNAGIGLTWDLNLFRNSYKVNQSELEVKKSEEQIRDVKQKLKLRSESAIIALEDAKQRILSTKETVSLAERGLDLANKSYLEGVLNQIDVQDAELTLYNSRLGYYQAVYDYQIAKSELEKLLEK
ncbi:MAG TPA: TolC family protein [Ignavibacteria bacterium]|nr:TolC family protein [Ignavibacteria bacterium]HRJ99721.1 TolC family protein [Ignavibacteria bacterium]